MNKFIKIGFLALLSSVATLQAAEFESNVAMSSDYVWRGMTQTSEEPAISCLLYTSPSPRDKRQSRMPSSA